MQAPQLPETTAPALAGAISAADETRHGAAADLTGHGTILLVEDEEGLRALNARGLASRGYTVIEAGNGVEALEELEKQGGKVDLVVSDVVMPEMDGPTLMKELRKRNPDIKIIFVSGYAEDAFDKSLPDHEQFNFLPKPFTLKQLVDCGEGHHGAAEPALATSGRVDCSANESGLGGRDDHPARGCVSPATCRCSSAWTDQAAATRRTRGARPRPRLANIVLLVVFLVVAGAGVWLVNAMLDARAVDDCLAQGRRNCAPIEVPAR